MKQGKKGKAIENLQRNLNRLGSDLVVDGRFGYKTHLAVVEFQKANGVTADGIVGTETQKAITQALITQATSRPKTLSPKVERSITREELAKAYELKLANMIALPVREEGSTKNRSDIIDKWNTRVGAKLGSPYCASSLWCLWKDLCDELGLVFPMRPTASSQAFVNSVPQEYVRKAGELGKLSDAAVLQLKDDKARGHVASLRADQQKQPLFYMHEFNTDAIKGVRDGDGGHSKQRSTVDGSRLNAGKNFRAFVDIQQWIVDVNVKGS